MYTAALSAVARCRGLLKARHSNMNPAAIPELLPAMAELLELACRQVEKLGMDFEHLPRRHPFLMSSSLASASLADIEPPHADMPTQEAPFRSSNVELQAGLQDQSSFDGLYRSLLDQIVDAWHGSLRQRSAIKVRATIAALEQWVFSGSRIIWLVRAAAIAESPTPNKAARKCENVRRTLLDPDVHLLAHELERHRVAAPAADMCPAAPARAPEGPAAQYTGPNPLGFRGWLAALDTGRRWRVPVSAGRRVCTYADGGREALEREDGQRCPALAKGSWHDLCADCLLGCVHSPRFRRAQLSSICYHAIRRVWQPER